MFVFGTGKNTGHEAAMPADGAVVAADCRERRYRHIPLLRQLTNEPIEPSDIASYQKSNAPKSSRPLMGVPKTIGKKSPPGAVTRSGMRRTTKYMLSLCSEDLWVTAARGSKATARTHRKYHKDLPLSETGLFPNLGSSPRPSHHTRRARDDRAQNANGLTLHRTGCDFSALLAMRFTDLAVLHGRY